MPVRTLCRLTSGNWRLWLPAALERWWSNSVAVPATTSRYSPPVTARPPSASTVTPPRSPAPAKQYGHVSRPPGHRGRRRWLVLDVDDVEAALVAEETRDVQRLQPGAGADLQRPLSWPYREERVEPSAGEERQRQVEDPVLRVRVRTRSRCTTRQRLSRWRRKSLRRRASGGSPAASARLAVHLATRVFRQMT